MSLFILSLTQKRVSIVYEKIANKKEAEITSLPLFAIRIVMPLRH